MPVPLDHQIAELKREIGIRKVMYPRWVAKGTMKQHVADLQMARLDGALATLEGLREGRTPYLPAPPLATEAGVQPE